MMTLAHLTLNTGHLRMSPRSEVSDETIRLVESCLIEGGSIPTLNMLCHVDRKPGRAHFALTIGPDIKGGVMVGGIGWEASSTATWRSLEKFAYSQAEITGEILPPLSEPDHLPWLAVMLAPFAALIDPDSLMMLGDFGRCLAWTILAQEGLGGL